MFWRTELKAPKLSKVEVTLKVIEKSKNVPIEHLQSFIQYSINIFPRCLNKENYRCYDQKLGQIICK